MQPLIMTKIYITNVEPLDVMSNVSHTFAVNLKAGPDPNFMCPASFL